MNFISTKIGCIIFIFSNLLQQYDGKEYQSIMHGLLLSKEDDPGNDERFKRGIRNDETGREPAHQSMNPQQNQLTINDNSCGLRTVSFNPQRNAKIVGGVPAPYGAYPWQVQIQIFRYDGMRFAHHCGGAVVGEHLVLTAAHCVQVYDSSKGFLFTL